ncbi:High affinity cAMP-specific and IBMX-insensitive 3',5'-cyclic phosphodiesterase 8A [Labeo rohita]|uniref:High affinity cAMP-specific and IBMX-insensitive 3',5'-cyclic phosphodiesterase 8A n=1 Tax=Labeo rohita TaxID=84645 RepID=A0ABQ8ML61_LABRO|nr:High affinity cAMP-specific and IBMX-insensitive 3',5'-cyclic phosphodiesterase 8A [Labeo rohita]
MWPVIQLAPPGSSSLQLHLGSMLPCLHRGLLHLAPSLPPAPPLSSGAPALPFSSGSLSLPQLHEPSASPWPPQSSSVTLTLSLLGSTWVFTSSSSVSITGPNGVVKAFPRLHHGSLS